MKQKNANAFRRISEALRHRTCVRALCSGLLLLALLCGVFTACRRESAGAERSSSQTRNIVQSNLVERPVDLTQWQYCWTTKDLQEKDIWNRSEQEWKPLLLPDPPIPEPGKPVLWLRTVLPRVISLNAHLFIWELPAVYEVYLNTRLLYGSGSFADPESNWNSEVAIHRIIPLPMDSAGQMLILRLWSWRAESIQPEQIQLGTRGALIQSHLRHWFSFLCLGIVMAAVSLIAGILFLFRPHPLSQLYLSMLSFSFSLVSLTLGGAMSLVFDNPLLLTLGGKVAFLSSCIWLALLLAELLEGTMTRRLLRCLAVVQAVLLVIGVGLYLTRVLSFPTIYLLWEMVTMYFTLPVLALLVASQMVRRNWNAMIITAVGVLPFCSIALVAQLEEYTGYRIRLVRALPWASLGMVVALVVVAIRRAIHIMRIRLADEKLREHRRFLQTVIDAIPESTIVAETDGRVALANRAARELAGGCDPDADEVNCRQLPAHHIESDADSGEVISPIQQAKETGSTFMVTHEYTTGGHAAIVEVSVAPIFDDAGEVIQIIEAARDVTERKLAEKALAAARQHELEIGARIQQTLLFGRPPENFAGLEIETLIVPSQKIDGDFYDFIQHSDECLDILVGDVMGKGVPAALFGAATKGQFLRVLNRLMEQSPTYETPLPKDVVQAVHELVTDEMISMTSFVTIFFARMDMRRNVMTYVDCGHTGTVCYHAATGLCEQVAGQDIPLGFSPEAVYHQHELPLEDGDVLLFFSDGVTEAHDAQDTMYGMERLLAFLRTHHDRPLRELLDCLQKELLVFTKNDRFTDDLTCVAVRVHCA